MDYRYPIHNYPLRGYKIPADMIIPVGWQFESPTEPGYYLCWGWLSELSFMNSPPGPLGILYFSGFSDFEKPYWGSPAGNEAPRDAIIGMFKRLDLDELCGCPAEWLQKLLAEAPKQYKTQHSYQEPLPKR
jgi:hypothetical protein